MRLTLTDTELEQLTEQRHEQGLPPVVADDRVLVSAAAVIAPRVVAQK